MGGGRLIQFATVLILADLLAPEDFGLVALGFILINFLVIFRELGLGETLIQRQHDLDEAYSSALILFPILGIVLYIVAFLAAPYASIFFHQRDVVPLIRIMGFSIPIAALGMLPTTLVRKDLAFRNRLVPELLFSVGYGVVAIFLALRGYGAFSMVYGQIVAEALRSLAYWMVCPVRFRWRPSFRVTKEILGFGQKVTAGSFSIYVFNNMDQFAIGKLLGDAALGFYSFMFRIANFPAVNITHVVNQVLLPVYSMMQGDRERFRRSYIRATSMIAAATIPLAIGIVLFGREGLIAIYGSKWLPAVAVLQVLAIYGMLRSVGATFGSVLIVSSHPVWLFYGAGCQILAAGIALGLGAAKYGIDGVAIVMTTALIIGVVMTGIKVTTILDLKLTDWIRIIGVPLLVSVAIFGLLAAILPADSTAWLFAKIVIAALLYLSATYWLYRGEFRLLFQELRSSVTSSRLDRIDC